jgi:Flp pilus assembly protein CpaB
LFITVVGLLVAATGVLGTLYLAHNQQGNTSNGSSGSQVSVVVAAADLPAGHQIQAGDLATAQISASAAPFQAFTDVNTPIGQYVVRDIHKSQVLTSAMTVAAASTPVRTVAPIALPDGDVAVAIPDSDLIGAGGYIQPGDHIDILVDLTGNGDQAYAFQDVPVLRVGSNGSTTTTTTTATSLLLVQLPRRQAEEMGVLLEGKSGASIIRYVIRPVDQYGKGYLDSGSDAPSATPPSDKPIPGNYFAQLFAAGTG